MKRIAIICIALVAACATLTPEDKAQIAHDQIDLGVCAGEAHFEKHPDAAVPQREGWAAFDKCMVAHGFYDGGSDAR